MSHRPSSHRRPPRRSRQSGVLLGIVLILLVILFAAGLFALWSMRGDTASAGQDRLSRQLLDCAEQGLAWGKQNVSMNYNSSTALTSLLKTNICSTSTSSLSTIGPLPCWSSNGPFPDATKCTATPPANYPFTTQITMDSRRTTAGLGPDFEYTVAIYNDPIDTDPCTDTNTKVIVYSRCTDLSTLQQRSVSALISVTQSSSTDYTGQAGRGFRNQGNQNF